MEKHRYLKSNYRNFRDYLRPVNHKRQAIYNDKFLEPQKQFGEKIPFKHDLRMMAHMHDLRMWTIAYAPANHGNLQRLQEIHRLNNEFNYLWVNALYKRILIGIVAYFLIVKIFKKRYANKGAEDSHEISWRDTSAIIWTHKFLPRTKSSQKLYRWFRSQITTHTTSKPSI